MKTNIIMLGLAAALLSSCTDSFLDTTSKTTILTPSFYKTESEAQKALVGCYDQYQRTISWGPSVTMYQASEMMSDECYGGGSSNDIVNRLLDRFDQSMKTDATDIFSDIWTLYYKAVYNSNLLIGSLNKVTDWSSDNDRKCVEGEARAIRGLAYFDLVRMFERVPLLTEPSSKVVPQSEPDKVYEQIVTDLKYAADNIPADRYTDNSATLGHISRYAAAAMLARVYLFYDGVYNNNQGGTMPGGLTKADALRYCESVISSGYYRLEDNFTYLWPGASTRVSDKEKGRDTDYKEDSKELLWVVKFNNDQNWTNGKKDYNSFVINIGMPSVSCAPFGNGWGHCPISPVVTSWFGEGDRRADASIINSKKLVQKDNTTVYSSQIKTDCNDFTGLTIRKYSPLVYSDGTPMGVAETDVTGGNLMLQQDQDYVLMRYADVLLMAAELGSPNSATYYNKVVERAYGNTSHDVSAPTRQQIWDQRRAEFVGEGLRYWDLRRQGLDTFVNTLAKQTTLNGTDMKVYDNTKEESIAASFKAENIRAKRGFWQIPAGEIRLSGNVYEQNPGW